MRTLPRRLLGALLASLLIPAAASAASQTITINVPAIHVLAITGGPINFQFTEAHWSTDPQAVSDVSSTQTAATTLVWRTNAGQTSPVKITVQVDQPPPAWVHLFKVEVGSPTVQAGSGSCGTRAVGGVDLGTTAQAVVTDIYHKACVAEATYSVAVDLDGSGTYAATVMWTIGP